MKLIQTDPSLHLANPSYQSWLAQEIEVTLYLRHKGFYRIKKGLSHYFMTFIKINSKCIKQLKCKREIITHR